MTRALSVDLRKRKIAAVTDGQSCRQAATRFGVSAWSAIRWNALARTKGDAASKRQGGDRRPARIEAHAALIRDAIRAAISAKGFQHGVNHPALDPAPVAAEHAVPLAIFV